MKPVLRVNGVGKAYRSYPSEWLRVARWFYLPVRPSDEHWVLRNIHFSVGPGEAVGIVGENGAGKSTLLKMITGTLQPTEGDVALGGRVSAILELGMGFNPELTGRQNARHSAGLMGHGVEAVEAAMQDIEAFAEIGPYFDEPVRTYSSGMQMRVAFAVATAFRPELLIVDEALSVGDAYFQHKSFARIREFQDQGTSLLIVSHDRGAIQGLCSRAILLEGGRVSKDGRPEEVMDFYNAMIAEKENATLEVRQLEDGAVQTLSGTGEVRTEDIMLLDAQGRAVEFVDVGEQVTLRVIARTHAPIPRLVFGYGIRNRLGQVMYGTNTELIPQVLLDVPQGAVLTFEATFNADLGQGSYSVQTAFVSTGNHLENNYEWRDLALVFNVVNLRRAHFEGLAWIEPVLRTSIA
ncbi:sugar ABC transporter ATP-binding protein [Lysobacteraceae bacterium NML93-0792]|nr:sugar ABC transporter ATP-binding protein [Xanthomonadaceae bacterium NML93-0792]PBS15288.1 sugar ABC transporter ATP-binding protein [Xanthomonadaceae bacterium NML93-0793]PBS18140.1 sugar ABC transporter ATP-binding protein [Xanthomonadaceae bacterium NML93-0831]